MGWGTYSPLKMVYVCIYLPHEKGYVGIYLALKRVWVWYIFTPEKGVGWVHIYPCIGCGLGIDLPLRVGYIFTPEKGVGWVMGIYLPVAFSASFPCV